MPLELIADKPAHAILQPYAEPPLSEQDVHVLSLFSSVKHGTELRVFSGQSEDAARPFDHELRLHRSGPAPAPGTGSAAIQGTAGTAGTARTSAPGTTSGGSGGAPPPAGFPMALGNMCYGTVVKVGAAVTRFKVGDRVFAHLPLRETHTVPQSALRPAPPGVSPRTLMYWDPASFAVGGVRDGNVRLGDRVAVFGLGAIGQMAVQLAKIAGARWVVAVDPIEVRRQAAARHGADFTLDPRAVDAGVELKTRTDKLGVDVSIETSGSSHALYDALRCVRYRGTVVSTAYYVGALQGLHFAGEFHRNRPTIISSRACSEPQLDFGWDYPRIEGETLALLTEGRLRVDDLIDPVVPFARAAEAYHEINQHPERSIKLGVDHTLQ